MSTSRVELHRVLSAPAKVVYKALTDPDAMVKWSPPHGFIGKMHKHDLRVGGKYRMSFINLHTGKSHAFGGAYTELVANEKIVYTDTFEDPNLPGEMRTEIRLRADEECTWLTIIQEAVPTAIPLRFCYLGWQQSLQMLAQLVEAEVGQG